MDATRYAKLRELFLAAEDLSPEDRDAFLRAQTDQDEDLYEEVCSLLREHDPESANREGNHPSRILDPRTSDGQNISAKLSRPAATNSELEAPRHDPQTAIPEATESTLSQNHSSWLATQAQTRSAPTSSSLIWAQQTRRSRRRNNKWLWLAALLPTALIGWFTYRQVNTTMKQSVRAELRGIADSVSHAARRFMIDKTRLVESWSRQPDIHSAILELVELQKNQPSSDVSAPGSPAATIQSLLQQLSGLETIQFVVWSDGYRTLASSDPRLGSVGSTVDPRHAAMIARVMSGENIVFGPQRIDLIRAAAGDLPEPPVMAIVVPVTDADGRILAAFLVGGSEMFDEFSRMFFDIANTGNLDAYAVNRSGIMVTESPRAATLASMRRLDATVEEIAARLRIADPGTLIESQDLGKIQRDSRPLTLSTANVTIGGSEVEIEPYRNYAGQQVVGAWRWNSDSDLGVIVERQADAAFATVRIVQRGFLLLGTLLFITASLAAAFLARASTAERVAVHPLSRYEILRELGSGGMGLVYLARHRQLGRETALKVMIGGRRHREDQSRFDREARLAASLSNPHSVMVYDYGRSEDGESYCAMEFLRGLTLQEVVERGGPQPIGRVLFIISQICEALVEAHELNLLHRDIKPQNIMLSLDQSVGDWAVLFDYGLAKPLEPVVDVYQTSESHWSGTPMYMAPERFRNPNSSDRRSDIYSLGCVAYFLLAGRPPFAEGEAESLFALILGQCPDNLSLDEDEPIAKEISELVSKCMAKSADDRFASVRELAVSVNEKRFQYPWTVEEARSWWDQQRDQQRDR